MGVDTGGATDGGQWITYAELAEKRMIKKINAIRLARRHRWRRQAGNDGLARVLVPEDMLQPAEGNIDGKIGDDTNGDTGGDTEDRASRAAFTAALDAIRDAHAAELDRALALLTDAGARADRAEAALTAERARADELRDQLDAAKASAEQAEARGDRAQAELERARVAGREALQAAETLRQEEAARRARGLLARLRAAWRGE